MAYPEIWFQGLSVVERAERERRLRECSDVLRALDKILKDDFDATFRKLREDSNYELPNWQLKVADTLGNQKSILRTINYITDR